MNFLRQYLDKIKPTFTAGGKMAMFHSVFEGIESFLFVSNATAGADETHIHASHDSKRAMSIVVIALIPCLLFGMFNLGAQHFAAIGAPAGWLAALVYGLFAVLPMLVVSYGVGLGIEFAVAQWKGHEIQEGFLVSGMLIPLIVPVNTPLWMIGVATAFSVVFCKEVFGGTGFNIWNPALIARAFLFFAYPSKMSGEAVWISTESRFGYGGGQVVDGFSGATPLSHLGSDAPNYLDMFLGFIPGSVGETSKLCILIGALILLATGIASWRTMLSVFAGGLLTAWLFNLIGANVAMQTPPLQHILLGGFAFGAVFMATDPVTSPRSRNGKYVFGFLVGTLAILIRILNPGYPEGMMLAILLMNSFAPLIDHCVVQNNINRRLKRIKQ
ncbi:Na(+)-translocating NADH-quinone reductase subunit B [Bacteroidia bacterium]|nr:Na(+)-translocating NADH-quinone reductase subunit B [Bacteroidia bacterium]